MSFILIGNNLLNASPYDGEKFKLRSVKERHSEYPETVASSLIIYSCLRMSRVSCTSHPFTWCTFPLSASSYDVTLCTWTSCTVFRSFFSSTHCSQMWRRFGFWTVTVQFSVFLRVRSRLLSLLDHHWISAQHISQSTMASFQWVADSAGYWHAH